MLCLLLLKAKCNKINTSEVYVKREVNFKIR